MQEELVKNGWQIFNSHLKSENCIGYYKSFAGHKECNFNKRGVKQVEIYVHQDPKLGEYVEIDCCGQLADESWIKSTFLGLKEVTAEAVEKKVQDLLKIWDFAVELK